VRQRRDEGRKNELDHSLQDIQTREFLRSLSPNSEWIFCGRLWDLSLFQSDIGLWLGKRRAADLSKSEADSGILGRDSDFETRASEDIVHEAAEGLFSLKEIEESLCFLA
jgi:hypothetical protein